MPGASWYPFLLALSIVFGGYGILYQNLFVMLFSLGLTIFFTFCWAFEGVGGATYTVRRSTGEILSIDEGSH